MRSFRCGVLSVCLCDNRLVVAGFDEYRGRGRMRFRVGVFDVRDSMHVALWTDTVTYPIATLTSCLCDENYLYAIGVTSKFWSIILLDKRDFTVTHRVDFEDPYITPLSLVKHREFLYVAGTQIIPGKPLVSHVAMISTRDFKVTKSYTPSISEFETGVNSIVFNEKTGELIVGGYYKCERSGLEWLLVFLSEDLRELRVVKPGFKGVILSLAVDAEGSIYAVDNSRLVKFTSRGELIRQVNVPSVLRVFASQNSKSIFGSHVAVLASREILLFNTDLNKVDSISIPGIQVYIPEMTAITGDMDTVFTVLTTITSPTTWQWQVTAAKLTIK